MVNASSPFQTLGDFLKAASEKPGTLNVGTVNVGSTQNLTAELFKSMAGIDVVIVPFRGSPDVVVALLRNDIQMAIDFYAALKPTLDGGKARALATSGPQRSPELPDVPTVQEGGVAGFDVTAWNGLYAPAGTPDAIVETLNKALHEVLADPDLKKRALDLGIDAKASTPAELDARLRGDIEKWGKVIARPAFPSSKARVSRRLKSPATQKEYPPVHDTQDRRVTQIATGNDATTQRALTFQLTAQLTAGVRRGVDVDIGLTGRQRRREGRGLVIGQCRRALERTGEGNVLLRQRNDVDAGVLAGFSPDHGCAPADGQLPTDPEKLPSQVVPFWWPGRRSQSPCRCRCSWWAALRFCRPAPPCRPCRRRRVGLAQ